MAVRYRFLFLLLAINLVRGLIYSAIVPPWGTPDEPRHMEYVQLLYRKKHLVGWGDATPEVEQAIIRSMDRYGFWRWGQSDWKPPYPGALPERFQQVWAGGLAHELHQPPLAYVVYASSLPLTAGWDIAVQLYVMRLLSILLGTFVVLIGFLVASELFAQDDVLALSIPAFITFLPMHTFLLSGLNNDHLAEVSTSIVYLLLVLVFKRGASLFKVFGIALALVVALLAKRTALVMIPTLAAATILYLWGRWRQGNLKWRRVSNLGGGLIALLAGLVFLERVSGVILQYFPGIARWIRFIHNVYLFLPSSQFRFSPDQPYLSSLALRLYGHYLNAMFESFWARFGWMNIRPGGGWYAAFGLITLASLIGLGLFAFRLRRGEEQLTQWQKQIVLLFAISVVLMLTIVIGREIRNWDLRWGGWPQGRFLFPVIVPIATLFMLGLHALLPVRYRGMGVASLIGFLVIADAIFLVGYIVPFFYGTPPTLADAMTQVDDEGPMSYLPLVVHDYERPSPTPTMAASSTPSGTPSRTLTVTSTATPTDTPTPKETGSPITSATPSPTATATQTHTVAVTDTPTPTPTTTASATPAQTRSPTSTRTPTATPTMPGEGGLTLFGVTVLGSINDPAARRLARSAGIRWVRTSISWSSVEPDNLDLTNPANGGWRDDLFQSLDTDGLSPVLLVWQNPSWAAPADCGPLYDGMLPEFGQFIHALAERYDGDDDYNGDGIPDGPALPNVHYYEFYNEPDLNPNRTDLRFGGCWGDRGTEYAALLREAYENVKAANPSAQIMTGGLAYDSHYNRPDAPSPPACYVQDSNFFNYYFLDDILATTFEDGTRGGDYFDIINFHYHRGSRGCWAPWGPEALGKANYLQNKLASMGLVDKGVAVTEDGEKRYDPRPGHENDYSDDGQARYVVMSLTRALAGRFAVLTWFTFDHFVDNLGREWGLLTPDGNPRPSYEAYQTLTEGLGGSVFLASIEVPGGEGYEFRVGDVRKSVLWTTSGTTAVPFTGGRFQVVDKYGVTTTITDGGPGDQDGSTNGRVTISVTSDPVYVQPAP